MKYIKMFNRLSFGIKNSNNLLVIASKKDEEIRFILFRVKRASDDVERCQSGLMCPLGKRVYRKVSKVRILFSPPKTLYIVDLFNL